MLNKEILMQLLVHLLSFEYSLGAHYASKIKSLLTLSSQTQICFLGDARRLTSILRTLY